MTLRKPPAKVGGKRPPYAEAYADVLPAAHRDALRDAAIHSGGYLPQRYEHYHDGRFARDWATHPRRGRLETRPARRSHTIRQAQVLLDLADASSRCGRADKHSRVAVCVSRPTSTNPSVKRKRRNPHIPTRNPQRCCAICGNAVTSALRLLFPFRWAAPLRTRAPPDPRNLRGDRARASDIRSKRV